MSDYKIVATTDLAKYQRNARMGTVSMMVGMVAVVASGFISGRAVGRYEAFTEAQEEVEKLQRENREIVQTFVLAWENQQEGFRLIETWAQYIRGRQESLQLNQGLGPIPRPNWPQRKTLKPSTLY